MSFRRLSLSLLSAAVIATPMLGTAQAEEGIYIPLLTYRTGAFADRNFDGTRRIES